MDAEEYNRHAAEGERARRESPLREHMKDVLAKAVESVEEEAGAVEPEEFDRSRYTVHVPDPEDKFKHLAWENVKKALPCPEAFEAAITAILEEVISPDSKLSLLEKAQAVMPILKYQYMVHVAAIKARG